METSHTHNRMYHNTAWVLTSVLALCCQTDWSKEQPPPVCVHIIQKNKAFFPSQQIEIPNKMPIKS